MDSVLVLSHIEMTSEFFISLDSDSTGAEAVMFLFVRFSFPRCCKRLVSEFQMAPIKNINHSYTVCRAYPYTIVSNNSFMILALTYIPPYYSSANISEN